VPASFWLWHPLGVCPRGPTYEQCLGYNAWSGILSDLSEITLLIAVVSLFVGFYRHTNCNAPRCLRIGRHQTADGLHHLCRKHHPDLPDRRPSLAEIHRHHQAAKGEPHESVDA